MPGDKAIVRIVRKLLSMRAMLISGVSYQHWLTTIFVVKSVDLCKLVEYFRNIISQAPVFRTPLKPDHIALYEKQSSQNYFNSIPSFLASVYYHHSYVFQYCHTWFCAG